MVICLTEQFDKTIRRDMLYVLHSPVVTHCLVRDGVNFFILSSESNKKIDEFLNLALFTNDDQCNLMFLRE